MRRLLRLQGWLEYARGTLWVVPTMAIVAAVVIGAALSHLTLPQHSWAHALVYRGGTDGARGMLQAIAGSVITVTGTTFSLTVVTLQLASSQFSPRLLRTFLRDPVTQVTLATLLATFAYSLTVLRRIRSGSSPFIPDVAVTVGFALALATTGCIVWFINHIVREIRIDQLMEDVERETLDTIDRIYAEPADDSGPALPLSPVPDHAVAVADRRSGFVQAVDLHRVCRVAVDHDLVVRVEAVPGDRVLPGTPLAWWWPDNAAPPDSRQCGDVAAMLTAAMQVGFERTVQQDVGYGLRQLVDIAVKAMSPGVNDPTTASHAIGHLSAVLAKLAERHTAPHVLRDDQDRPRVHVARPTFDEYLELACGEIRRYSGAEPNVLISLLTMLRAVGSTATDDGRRQAVLRQAALIVRAADHAVEEPHDLDRVHAAGATLQRWVRGDRRPDPVAPHQSPC